MDSPYSWPGQAFPPGMGPNPPFYLSQSTWIPIHISMWILINPCPSQSNGDMDWRTSKNPYQSIFHVDFNPCPFIHASNPHPWFARSIHFPFRENRFRSLWALSDSLMGCIYSRLGAIDSRLDRVFSILKSISF